MQYQEVLPLIDKWDISKQPEIWSKKRIDGEAMYKIHRSSARIVEETGLYIQDVVCSAYNEKEKIFPYFYQIINIEKDIKSFDMTDRFDYQSVTFITGEFENFTKVIDSKEIFSYEFDSNTYAFAILWSKEINPETPKWFVRPYHRMFM